MIIGVNLRSDDSTNGDTYFSPWFPRSGNKAVFSCDLINAAPSGNIDEFSVQVQTKNSEDSDKDAVDLLGTAQAVTITAGTITSFEAGAGLDSAADIAVGSDGTAWIVGETDSDEGSWPVQVGPDLTHNGGGKDAFVAKVRPDGTALEYEYDAFGRLRKILDESDQSLVAEYKYNGLGFRISEHRVREWGEFIPGDTHHAWCAVERSAVSESE